MGLFWISALFAVDRGLQLGVRGLPGRACIGRPDHGPHDADRARTLATTLRVGLPLTIHRALHRQRARHPLARPVRRRTQAEPKLPPLEVLFGGEGGTQFCDGPTDRDLVGPLGAEGSPCTEADLQPIERIDPEQGRARRNLQGLEGEVSAEWPDSPPFAGSWTRVVATAEFKRAQWKDHRFDLIKCARALVLGPTL